MSADWVTAAAQFVKTSGSDMFSAETGGSLASFVGTAFGAKLNRSLMDIEDRMARRQIRIASQADANARIRATQNLISAQRAALGASGVMGGRTARLLEAQARITAGRQQLQADQSRLFAETASRLQRTVGRFQSRLPVIKAGQDLLAAALSGGASPGSPGAAGGG